MDDYTSYKDKLAACKKTTDELAAVAATKVAAELEADKAWEKTYEDNIARRQEVEQTNKRNAATAYRQFEIDHEAQQIAWLQKELGSEKEYEAKRARLATCKQD
jgi:predicted ATP-binding protein involved in virulence